MRTNAEELAIVSVMGEVSHPTVKMPRIDEDGKIHYVPGVGGITYNFTLGDSAFKLYGDHVEPDVSTKNKNKSENEAYMMLSCIGNEAIVVSGEAKGMKGFVIGKHGGVDHVLIHFPNLEKLSIGDKILVKARGQGLKVLDLPQIRIYNIDPELFEKVFRVDGGKLKIVVSSVIPASMMGSGIGTTNPTRSDYDINVTMEDAKNLNLRIGDFVAIEDHDSSHGLGQYRKGYITVGVIVHSGCFALGHGPGVVVVATGPEKFFDIDIGDRSNLKDFLEVV